MEITKVIGNFAGNTTNKYIESRLDIVNNLIASDNVRDNMIDDVLHVITVISNPCGFKRRWELADQFIERMSHVKNIILYVVETVYGDQEYHITSSNNPHHLQLRTQHPLWHKENMINLGVKYLLPKDWKAMAWIDADLEFDNSDWPINTLKILTYFDIMQPYVECHDLDENEMTMKTHISFGYNYAKGGWFDFQKNAGGDNFWNTGYAWACTRQFYDKIGYIYDKGIVGSGDFVVAQAILGNIGSRNKDIPKYNQYISEYIKNFRDIKVGYVPVNIKHYFHGSKIKRQYIERSEMLSKYNYDPLLHVAYDSVGITIPSNQMPSEFVADIFNYFRSRDDDEYYDLIKK